MIHRNSIQSQVRALALNAIAEAMIHNGKSHCRVVFENPIPVEIDGGMIHVNSVSSEIATGNAPFDPILEADITILMEGEMQRITEDLQNHSLFCPVTLYRVAVEVERQSCE